MNDDIRFELPVGCCNRKELRFKLRFKKVGRAEIAKKISYVVKRGLYRALLICRVFTVGSHPNYLSMYS
jgi:hypothetical protein